MSNSMQDHINERVVTKLEELFEHHNRLVMATAAILAQLNELALRVQALEEKHEQAKG